MLVLYLFDRKSASCFIWVVCIKQAKCFSESLGNEDVVETLQADAHPGIFSVWWRNRNRQGFLQKKPSNILNENDKDLVEGGDKTSMHLLCCLSLKRLPFKEAFLPKTSNKYVTLCNIVYLSTASLSLSTASLTTISKMHYANTSNSHPDSPYCWTNSLPFHMLGFLSELVAMWLPSALSKHSLQSSSIAPLLSPAGNIPGQTVSQPFNCDCGFSAHLKLVYIFRAFKFFFFFCALPMTSVINNQITF